MVKRLRQFFPFILILLICGIAVFAVDVLFLKEVGDQQAEIIATNHEVDYIEVDANVILVDPITEHLTFRLDFIPHGRFDAGDGLLAVPVEVSVSSIDGDQIQFEAQRLMFPHEVTVDMFEGEVEGYPFDSHHAVFEILVVEEGESQGVPIELDLLSDHHGYVFNDVAQPKSSHGYLGYDLYVKRSPLVVWTVIFCMVIIWALTIVNMFIYWLVLKDKMEVDLGLFGYMSGFIVALFFFRQIFPDVPPFLGVFADYAAFFWAELVTAGISIGLALKWFYKTGK
jgi:hypothetical protein